MTLVADLAVPYIRLTLDTRAPTLVVTATGRVSPPDPWPVAVTADESLADASLVLTDSLGVEHSVGFARIGDRTFDLMVPTVGLPTGPATLEGWIADLAGNRALVHQSVVIDRPKGWDADLTLTHAWEASVSLADGFDTVLDLGHGFEATEEHTPAWDATLTPEHGYDTTLEQSHGE